PAPAFLPQYSDFLAQADLGSGLDGRIDRLQVAVAMVPTTFVEQIDHIVTRFRRAVVVAGEDLFAGRDDAAGRRRDHLHQSLGSAGVEAVVIINLFRPW